MSDELTGQEDRCRGRGYLSLADSYVSALISRRNGPILTSVRIADKVVSANDLEPGTKALAEVRVVVIDSIERLGQNNSYLLAKRAKIPSVDTKREGCQRRCTLDGSKTLTFRS